MTPINLIPSCTDCNRAKIDKSPLKSEEETLHPYYDNIENDEWLFASVRHTTPPTVYYFVKASNSWSVLLSKRVQYHFNIFALNNLYSVQAAVLLSDIEHRLESIFKISRALGVKNYLKEEAISRFSSNKNSLQTAFYMAVSQDDWYCNGGFRMK